MEKLYVIGTFIKDDKLIGARFIDIEHTRNAKTGNKIPIMDFDKSTIIAGIKKNMIPNLYLTNKGEIKGRHGILEKYPIVNSKCKNSIVVIGRRNYDTVDYITFDGIVHTCGIIELSELSKTVSIANAAVFTKYDKYILKETNWKIIDDLTLAEQFIDGKNKK